MIEFERNIHGFIRPCTADSGHRNRTIGTDLIGILRNIRLGKLDNTVADIKESIGIGKGEALHRAAVELNGYIGIRIITGTTQCDSKVDIAVKVDVRAACNFRQKLRWEATASYLNIDRTVEGIRSLGRQNTATDLEVQLIDFHRIIFVLYINIRRFYRFFANKALRKLSRQMGPWFFCCTINREIPVEPALYGIALIPGQLQKAGQVTGGDRRPGHDPAVRRIIAAVGIIRTAVLHKVEIIQMENTAVIGNLPFDILEQCLVEGKLI